MEQRRSPDNLAAVEVGDALVSQTYSQRRDLLRDGLQHFSAYPEVPAYRRHPRPGRDDDSIRFERFHAIDVDDIVANDHAFRAKLFQGALQVVHERIIIVDQEHFHADPSPAWRNAALSAPSLISVSSYSLAGSESATIPAPAWKCSLPPEAKAERMVIAESRFPFIEM